MVRVAIIGGKLQGLEAVYLASKAGIETVVIDKRENVPARNLCNHFLCSDVLKREPQMISELKKADFVLPALEEVEALECITELAGEYNLKLAYDLEAYRVSSSKLLSDKLMLENNIPAPRYYPDCKAPYIAKPSTSSGSEGVKLINTRDEMESFMRDIPEGEEWVVQEYLAGRSYSIEVIGMPGNYKTYEVTEIIIDDVYDCKRVEAPCDISSEMKKQLSGIAMELADILKLKGIMDVEVIDDEGTPKVLEIDARIPSQTPTAVYHSSGVNMVAELADIFCGGCLKGKPYETERFVSYEHLLIKDGKISTHGEHIIGEAGSLSLKMGFCGADEVITDFEPGSREWRGTFINIAENRKELEEKRVNMIRRIRELMREELEFIDLEPEKND